MSTNRYFPTTSTVAVVAILYCLEVYVSRNYILFAAWDHMLYYRCHRNYYYYYDDDYYYYFYYILSILLLLLLLLLLRILLTATCNL